MALQVDEEFARGYYFYLDPKRQRLEYKSAIRMHEQADGRSSTMSSWSGRWN